MIRPFRGVQVRAANVAVLLWIALASVACSSTASLGSTTPGTGTVASPTTQTVHATPPADLKAYCGVVSAGEIQAAINKPITVAFPPFGSTKGDIATLACGFGTSLTAAPVIEIEFSQTINGNTKQQFDAFKTSFISTTPIPNLGDEAYVGMAPPDKNTETNIHIAVVVRQGSFFFFVGQFNDDSSTVIPNDQKVAQLYSSRL
jgi:hypothetical protein